LERYESIFLLTDTEDDVKYYQMELSQMITKIIRIVLQIYQLFCRDNYLNQLTVLRKVVPMIIRYTSLNLG
jgi:hypothetical protein